MLFVGIDVAKSHHDVAILDDSGQVVLRHLRILNNRQGFDKLHQTLVQLTAYTDDNDLLTKYPSPAKLSRAHSNTLVKLLHNHGNRLDMAQQLKVLAKQSIGLSSPANALELVQTISVIRLYDEQINAIDQEIVQTMNSLDEAAIVTSIAGISQRLGSVILSEINHVNNFQSPDQLLAFAGLEPSVYQSGQISATGKIVKRGSTSLRWALFQAAEYASRWSPTLRQYRQKKLDEGKHYYVVMTHVAKKLVRIIYYLLKHHQYYDESKLI